MEDGDALIEGSQGSSKAAGGVSLDDDAVGPRLLNDACDALNDPGRDAVQLLARGQDVEIVVGPHAEHLVHLIEHLAMLSGDGDHGNEMGGVQEASDEGSHFDGLGTCPIYKKKLAHDSPSRPAAGFMSIPHSESVRGRNDLYEKRRFSQLRNDI